eukprot:2817627-Amphidinium_carterae.3
MFGTLSGKSWPMFWVYNCVARRFFKGAPPHSSRHNGTLRASASRVSTCSLLLCSDNVFQPTALWATRTSHGTDVFGGVGENEMNGKFGHKT